MTVKTEFLVKHFGYGMLVFLLYNYLVTVGPDLRQCLGVTENKYKVKETKKGGAGSGKVEKLTDEARYNRSEAL